MKNNNRTAASVLFSLSFVVMAFCMRFAMMQLNFDSPMIVVFEMLSLVVMGWVVVQSWKSSEPFSCEQKRVLAALLGLYVVVNLLTFAYEQQLAALALLTIQESLSKNTVAFTALEVVKLLLPALGVWFACRSRASATVVFDEPAEPETLETEQGMEELTNRLDDAEEEA